MASVSLSNSDSYSYSSGESDAEGATVAVDSKRQVQRGEKRKEASFSEEDARNRAPKLQRKGPAAVSGAKASMPIGANAIRNWKEDFPTLSRDKWLRSGEQISPGWTVNLDEAGVWFLFEGRKGKFWTRDPDVEPIACEEEEVEETAASGASEAEEAATRASEDELRKCPWRLKAASGASEVEKGATGASEAGKAATGASEARKAATGVSKAASNSTRAPKKKTASRASALPAPPAARPALQALPAPPAPRVSDWERLRCGLADSARQERSRLPFMSHFLLMEWSLNNSFQIAT